MPQSEPIRPAEKAAECRKIAHSGPDDFDGCRFAAVVGLIGVT